jgi:hypothetical protein
MRNQFLRNLGDVANFTLFFLTVFEQIKANDANVLYLKLYKLYFAPN